jgi:hypothetical protein
MVEKLLVVKLHGANSKYTGQRIIKSWKRINSLKFRVVLLNGKEVTVESIEVIREIGGQSENG